MGMNKPKGKRYSKEEREELLSSFDQSGQSVTRFCREQGLSYPTLKRWLEGCAEETDGLRLIEVRSDGEDANDTSCLMTIRLPNGLECHVWSGSNRQEVLSWIGELLQC